MHPGTHYVGVDLAWGLRSPTGLAVLDEGGRLVHLSTVVTDDEITAALEPFTSGPCLVGLDAPLIVHNPTGNRPAEAALNKDFARFDAGAHPANTGKPELADTPRAARLSALLGLDVNPRSRRPRRAIEVYPHPATISLFGLGRTLKYKAKSGRTFEQLRGELLALMGLVAGLAEAEPPLVLADPWPQLLTQVERATRKAELRVVEDQVDAVLCAYVALFADRRPELTTTYGDLDTGYIVTPTLAEGHRPTPRRRRTVAEPAGETVEEPLEDPVASAVRQYAAQHAELRGVATGWVGLVRTILDDAGINYLSVDGRAKSVASFAAKAVRQVDGVPVYPDPLRDITDTVGIRVITYVRSDVDAVAALLGEQVVVHDDRDMGEETASQGRFGYASRHLLVGLDPARDGQPTLEPLRGHRAQVQIRTVLQHAWAEFEHDIRYKGTVPDEHVPEFDRRFTLAAGLLELADRELSAIRERLRPDRPAAPEVPADDDPRISSRELAAFLAGQYAEAGWSRTDHYEWISGLLLELGITSLQELGEVLRPIDSAAIVARMDYRYPPGAVRRLDDALLAAFGERYLALHGNAHRVPLLRTRLERIAPEAT